MAGIRHVIWIFTLIGCNVISNAQDIKHIDLNFNKNSFEIIQAGTRESEIRTLDSRFYFKEDPLLPAIPFLTVRVLVPGSAEMDHFTFDFDTSILEPDITLCNNSPVVSFSETGNTQFKTSKVQKFIDRYPLKVVEYVSTEKMRGYTFLCFNVSPFIFDGSEKTLFFIEKLNISVAFKRNGEEISRIRDDEFTRNSIKNMIINQDDIDLYYPLEARGDLKSAENNIDYLVITNEELKDGFTPLLEWKFRKGLKVELITVEEIYELYDDLSKQLKIKRCIYDYYVRHSVKWVLLGGDETVIPVQYCYGRAGLGIEDFRIPTDLFYACFDSRFDWNSFVNEKIGEPFLDAHDILPEVYISRIPVHKTKQLESFIYKTLSYEWNPPLNQKYDKILISGVKSWNIWNGKSDNHHRSEILYNRHISNYWNGSKYGFFDTGTDFPEGEDYDVIAENLTHELNKGYGIFHFSGHGNRKELVMETGKSFHTDDALNLSNTDKGIMISTSCEVSRFDDTDLCLAEALLINPEGGCVAFFGSSRYGFGIPDTSFNLGPSYKFSAGFFDQLFDMEMSDNTNGFAKVAALAKAKLSGGGRESHWFLQYALNPMGDPELPVYTKNPDRFENIRIYKWNNTLALNTGGVEGCNICFTAKDKNSDFQKVARNVSFGTFTEIPEEFNLTITALNYIPYLFSSDRITDIETNLSTYFRIFPNPASDYVNVEFMLPKGQLQLIDMNGRILLQQDLTFGMNSVPVSEQADGIYLLQITTAEERVYLKLLIHKK